MGLGDEDAYVFFVPMASAHQALSQLVSVLDNATFSIAAGERDRIATLCWDDKEYRVPIYAKTSKFFSGTIDGFTFESDQTIRLLPQEKIDRVYSGIWCLSRNIIVPSERFATRDGSDFELCQVELKFEMGSKYLRLDLNVWGGQYSGDIEEDQNFQNALEQLLALSDFCLFRGTYNLVSMKPAAGESDTDTCMLFDELGSPDEIEKVIRSWQEA